MAGEHGGLCAAVPGEAGLGWQLRSWALLLGGEQSSSNEVHLQIGSRGHLLTRGREPGDRFGESGKRFAVSSLGRNRSVGCTAT